MKGCEEITGKIDWYLKQFRKEYENIDTYVTHINCPRFGTGAVSYTHLYGVFRRASVLF